jgi:hypothetical protein
MLSTAENCEHTIHPLTGRAPGGVRLPAVTALGIQLMATLLTGLAAIVWARLALPALPVLVWAMAQGAVAALLARAAAMARWWLVIHFVFAPTMALALAITLPPWTFLVGFCALFVVHGATYRTQVPTHLSRKDVIAAVAAQLPRQPGFRCVDLGSGFGGVLSAFAKLRSDGDYHGVEAALLPFGVAWLRGRLNGYRLRWGSLWQVALVDYDVVYVYLSPAAMPRLWQKVRSEMRPGTLLISNSFAIPGVPPTQTLRIDGRAEAQVYLWRIGQTAC